MKIEPVDSITELLKKHRLYIFHHSIAYNEEDDDMGLAEVPYIASNIYNDDYVGFVREKTYWFCEDDDMKTLSELLNMTVEDVRKLEDLDCPRNVGRSWLTAYREDREWCDSFSEVEVLEHVFLVAELLSNPDFVTHTVLLSDPVFVAYMLKHLESKNESD